MSNLVDTHCHIQSAGQPEKGERATRKLWAKAPQLRGDKMIADAVADGVTRLICVGCDTQDSRLVAEFVKDRGNCWASAGIHPHEARHHKASELEEFAKLTALPKVIAIGECGLDYYYGHSPKEDQLRILKFQIELALKNNLPLIFHVRDAFDDFWPVFDQYKGIRGVLHSFTDSATNLKMALDRGLLIGVNGIATFTKNQAQLNVYRTIPISNLVLETDAPFLTPEPYRGSINEPKRVRVIAEFLGGLRGENREVLERATTENALKLFGIE